MDNMNLTWTIDNMKTEGEQKSVRIIEYTVSGTDENNNTASIKGAVGFKLRDGTAKVRRDDKVKSSSFAKVLSTTIIETCEDGSYLVPCSLMC